jgi:hypothetical protein
MQFNGVNVSNYIVQFLAIIYPSLQIAMVNYGGGGKHMYSVTYVHPDALPHSIS